MKARIAILSGVSLSNNPRVFKEALLLRQKGHHLTILGGSLDRKVAQADRELADASELTYYPVAQLDESFIGKTKALRARTSFRLAKALFLGCGIVSPSLLGYFTRELLFAARRLKADFYSLHLEQAMWVGLQLLRDGRSVTLDMEDWYSEDLLPEARRIRPLRLLKELERTLLNRSIYSSAPSVSMSKALEKEYSCRAPLVVYNSFPWSDREHIDGLFKDRRNPKLRSIHWYSQTLGLGRGLEDLFQALPFLNHTAEIHLRGKPVAGFEKWLVSQVSPEWRKLIFLHDPVSSGELLSRIAEHDIGLAAEMKYSLSRDLTITNKILHYLLAGLAVVASDTSGQMEVAAKASGAVHIYPSGDAWALARHLNALIAEPCRLEIAKRQALSAARSYFCLEKSANIFSTSIDESLRLHLGR